MTTLMIVYFCRKSLISCCFIDAITMFRHYVPVIKSMRHQQCGIEICHLIKIISFSPKFIVISGDPVHAFGHFSIPYHCIIASPFTFISAMDNIIQYINVFSQVSSGTPDQSIRTIIMIIGCIGSYWNYCFQTFHAGTGCCHRKGSIIGGPYHTYFASTPVRLHFFIPSSGSKTIGPST